MPQRARFLVTVPPFDRLDPHTLQQVADLVEAVRVGPQTWLVRPDEPSDGSLRILTSGTAVIVAATGVEEQTVGTCQPGDFVGLSGALTGAPHPVGVRTDGAAELLQVPRPALELCLTDPGFAAFFSRTLAERLYRTYGELVREYAGRTRGAGTPPWRRRVADLMRTPAATCAPGLSVGAVAGRLRSGGISSLVVVAGDRPVGIVTVTDLVSKVLAADRHYATPAEAVMTAPLHTVAPEAFYDEALLQMVRLGIKHLPVVGGQGRAVGMLTLGDLARVRGEGTLSVVDRLEREETLAGLAEAAGRIDEVLRVMVADGAGPAQILPVMTGLYDRLTRRIIALGVARLGEPPCDWCWLNLGSAGREEQFARTDQDNALIYAGPTPQVDAYFAALAAYVVDGLQRCGFARCPGDVMATNPAWRRSWPRWRAQVQAMVQRPQPEQIRLATIFLDFRPVAGNYALAEALRQEVWAATEAMPLFLYHLVRDDLANAVPIGPLRLLRTPLWGERKGRLNLKTAACVHVVDLLRALALRHRVAATSTLGRLQAVVRAGALGKDEADWVEIAYQTLMRLRIQEAVRGQAAGEPVGNEILLSRLSEPERSALKDALVAVARLQESIGHALAPGGV